MKKLYLSIFIMLGYSINLMSQISIGIESGLSISNVQFTEIDISSNDRTGMMIAIPISYKISDLTSISFNSKFIQKGFNVEAIGQSNYSRFRYHYLQFTPNIKFRILKGFHLGLGLYYAFKIGDYFKEGKIDWIDSSEHEIIKKNDFGVTPSIGYSINNLSLNIRYHYGLKNILNVKYFDSEGRELPNVKFLNRAFEIGLSYNFALQRKNDDDKQL